ncbi:hypothetical protein LACR_0599 [Lactococcus cremoris subsp. cremoris SK11]|uniref:Uncharacterized protein n=1 Tax=Lactococcus lactis subsp. cremoris (strain SK11) TaxID=272622 RepID=Q031F4_LACLS|nr:hypothetical protein LACR_0599 [Lactococcus cremoris subsp. cremoris SK11]KZK45004.1 hypothetical protein SK110_2090 [Lactococcus cremoris]
MIFGDEEEIKTAVGYVFLELSRSIMPAFVKEKLRLKKA